VAVHEQVVDGTAYVGSFDRSVYAFDLSNAPQPPAVVAPKIAWLHPAHPADTTLAAETETRSFPIGLPMPSVGISSRIGHSALVYITGYLIAASQRPATMPATKPHTKSLHPTH
jgi:hypothetical protein